MRIHGEDHDDDCRCHWCLGIKLDALTADNERLRGALAMAQSALREVAPLLQATAWRGMRPELFPVLLAAMEAK